jgi:hypothetical protein
MEAVTRPHPSDFTVDIKQLADGTWRVQIREVSAYWGEGAQLTEALDALRKRAVLKVSSKGTPDTETLRGAAAAFAAETAVENYLASHQEGETEPEQELERADSTAWDDVSVISFKRKPPTKPDAS